MTDSRLRGEWLGNMQFDELSDTAWRVFCGALMWSNENGTDGKIPKRYLRLLHPDGEQQAAFDELERALLWAPSVSGDFYYFYDWEGELGQNSAETVAAYKDGARLRAKAYRDRQRKKLEAKNTPRVTRDATDDATHDATAHVTRANTRDVGEGEEEVEVEERGAPTATISESGRSPRNVVSLPEKAAS